MPIIRANQLRKSFPTPNGTLKHAVDGVSFEIEAGTIYGLLGPNGAGKTTTLRMLGGLIAPTSGEAIIDGHNVGENPFAVKHSIGFLTANTGLYQRLSPREILQYFARLYGLAPERIKNRVDHLIDWLDMHSFADLRCGALSTGQKQRTSIARALVGDPIVLIMDEPTLGLDVLSNRIILDFIRREHDHGKTIILSTHYLDEAETICDRIGLMHGGKLMAEGTMQELQALSGEEKLSAIFLKLFGEAQGEDENGRPLA
ncbi:MAG TPA: ATP-binding cassette domain-containing protein [Phycisphaerae bacterium]|nr:ATP-binding cassette domain-containing protein [Phycisphaerales bacterium]HNO76425.1 ATP-binding cassette domain-containing protein [Phycisphaerae bacterium]